MRFYLEPSTIPNQTLIYWTIGTLCHTSGSWKMHLGMEEMRMTKLTEILLFNTWIHRTWNPFWIYQNARSHLYCPPRRTLRKQSPVCHTTWLLQAACYRKQRRDKVTLQQSNIIIQIWPGNYSRSLFKISEMVQAWHVEESLIRSFHMKKPLNRTGASA